MLRTEIFINNTKVDLLQDVGISLNFQIADITKPDKRMASFSKTIKIPGSKTNNNLFSHIYEISKESLSTNESENFTPDFNPNLRANCEIYVDSILVMRGFARLLEVNINNGVIEYEVSVLGSLSNIFNEITNLKIHELDFSEYDHTWTKANQVASWSSEVGEGYVYPLIDLGFTSNQTEFDVQHLYPSVYAKTILDKIFERAGFTYTSNFFNSDFFKRLIVPFTGDIVKLNKSQLDERKFLANSVDSYSYSVPIKSKKRINHINYDNDTITYLSFGMPDVSSSIIDGLRFLNDSVAPAFDNNNVYDSTYGHFSPYRKGYYDLTFNFKGKMTITIPTGMTIVSNFSSYLEVVISCYKGFNRTTYNNANFILEEPTQVADGVYEVYFDNQLKLSNAFMDVDDYSIVWIRYISPGGLHLNQTSEQVIADVNFEMSYDSEDTNLFNTPVVTPLSEGETLFMNSVIPNNIAAKDYFMSLITMFNLYVDTDSNNEKNLLIEPLVDFYSGNSVINWTDKIDYSKEISIKPVSEIEGRNYIFSYKPDTDYYNETYKSVWDETYGQRDLSINNDFAKGERKFDIIFSPTPSVGSATSSIVIPKIYKVDDNGLISPKSSNIRLLYYGGLKSGNWTYVSSGSTTYESEYPYAGHLDSVTNPTIDLLWQEPQQIYWQGSNIGNSYTNNNLYNKYYRTFIEEITSKDSKIVSAYFKLHPLDIYQLNFKNFIFVDGINYRLNKVIDYNPLGNGVTKVELQKLKAGIPFSAQTTTVGKVGNSIENVTILEGGLDEVRDISATSPWHIVDGGLDTVRPLSATSTVFIVDGGLI